MLKCPRCGTGLSRERALLRTDVARENVMAMADYYPFTPAERETVLLAVEGLSYRDIAVQRGTTEQVVKNRMTQILNLTGFSTRNELMARFTLGTVPDTPSRPRQDILNPRPAQPATRPRTRPTL